MKHLQLLLIATLGILFLQCKKDTPAPVVTIDSTTPANGTRNVPVANNTISWKVDVQNISTSDLRYNVYVKRRSSAPSGIHPYSGTTIQIGKNLTTNSINIGTILDYGLDYNIGVEVQNTNGEIFQTVTFDFSTPNTITDSRDGNSYDIITYGNQTWMIENFRYLPEVTPLDSWSTTVPCYYVLEYNGTDVNAAKQWEYENINVYNNGGVFYNYKGASTLCSNEWTGFHLPSVAEWDTLFNTLDKYGTAYNYAIEDMTTNDIYQWTKSSVEPSPGFDATNYLQFNIIPFGFPVPSLSSGNFQQLNYYAIYWTSTIVKDGGGNDVGNVQEFIYNKSNMKSSERILEAGNCVRYMKEVEVLTAVN